MVIRGEPVGRFTDSAEDLNLGLLGTNLASGQGGTEINGLQIRSPALKPLAHVSSINVSYRSVCGK